MYNPINTLAINNVRMNKAMLVYLILCYLINFSVHIFGMDYPLAIIYKFQKNEHQDNQWVTLSPLGTWQKSNIHPDHHKRDFLQERECALDISGDINSIKLNTTEQQLNFCNLFSDNTDITKERYTLLQLDIAQEPLFVQLETK